MVDVALTFGLLAFVFFQFSNLTSKQVREIYNRHPSFIPGWIFGPVWTILYICIFFSGYEAFISTQNTNLYIPMLTLFIINLFLNKYWMVAFFDNESPGWALLIIFAINLTGIPIPFLMGFSDLWVSMGLYLPYVVWVILATILNMQWYAKCCGNNDNEDVGEILPSKMRPPPVQTLQHHRRNVTPPKMPRRNNGLIKAI